MKERECIALLDRAIINHYQSRPCFICHFAIIIYLRMTYPSCLRFEAKTIARVEREKISILLLIQLSWSFLRLPVLFHFPVHRALTDVRMVVVGIVECTSTQWGLDPTSTPPSPPQRLWLRRGAVSRRPK